MPNGVVGGRLLAQRAKNQAGDTRSTAPSAYAHHQRARLLCEIRREPETEEQRGQTERHHDQPERARLRGAGLAARLLPRQAAMHEVIGERGTARWPEGRWPSAARCREPRPSAPAEAAGPRPGTAPDSPASGSGCAGKWPRLAGCRR